MKVFDTIIEGGLILLIAFTPLALGSVHRWAYTTMGLTVLLLVTIWLLKMSYEGVIWIPKTPLNIPILLFIGLILLQLIPLPDPLLKTISPQTHRFYTETLKLLSPSSLIKPTLSLSPYATREELLKFLSYIGVFFLIMGNFTTERRVKRLLIAIVITGFLVALFGLIQRFTWNGRIYWFKEFTPGASPFGPFINRNSFAGYMNLIIPISLALFMVEGDKGKRMLFAFMGVIMAVALFFSLSRGGIIAFTGGMAFMGMLLLSLRYEKRYKKTGLLLGGFLISILLYLLYIGIGPVIDRLATLTEEETYLREGRFVVWGAAIGIIRDYPFFGTGLGTFEEVFYRYMPLKVSGLRWLAHNDYIQFAVETGIAGVLIATIFFILLFKDGFSKLNSERTAYLITGILSSIVAFMISIILDFHTHIPACAFLFATLLAITLRIGRGSRAPSLSVQDRSPLSHQRGVAS